MLKKILVGVVVVIGAFLIVAALQPADYAVTRSATIPAAPGVVFAQVNDLHQWQAWSPWEKLDPAMKRTFEGPSAGVGASYGWVGNKDVGEGRMTITESRPNERVLMKLEFIKPFASTCDTDFTFKPAGNETAVTWTMSGRKNFMSKAVCMFMSMDKILGGDFEKGLANLRTVATAASAQK